MMANLPTLKKNKDFQSTFRNSERTKQSECVFCRRVALKQTLIEKAIYIWQGVRHHAQLDAATPWIGMLAFFFFSFVSFFSIRYRKGVFSLFVCFFNQIV